MPLPVILVVKKGSKMRSTVSTSMPLPVSLIAIAIIGSSAPEDMFDTAIAERAAVGHGIARVGGDVEDRRLELVAVDGSPGSCRRGWYRSWIRSPIVRSRSSVISATSA